MRTGADELVFFAAIKARVWVGIGAVALAFSASDGTLDITKMVVTIAGAPHAVNQDFKSIRCLRPNRSKAMHYRLRW
jgi:hypothetical protein